MMERLFVIGNEAIGWGALMADCDAFFGYPITPQNEVAEWFSREFPRRGKVFFQATSETSAINLVYGAAAYGVRVMTSTSGPGWSLMQETMSHLANAELPAVVVLVQRGGPGMGTTRHSQMDYFTATRCGGHGGYKNIVLCPSSVQETHDLMQLAFYLADKYRNPVVVLTDALIGMTLETLELEKIDFGPLPEKDWTAKGRARNKDGQIHIVNSSQGLFPWPYPNYLAFLTHLDEKYKAMTDAELRYESYQVEDAELILVAYGYPSGVCREACDMARSQGLRVGLVRPITAWPFPYQVLREKARQGVKFLVVEDSLGLMVEDVQSCVMKQSEVHLLNMLARHSPGETGLLFPERVFEEIRRLL